MKRNFKRTISKKTLNHACIFAEKQQSDVNYSDAVTYLYEQMNLSPVSVDSIRWTRDELHDRH